MGTTREAFHGMYDQLHRLLTMFGYSHCLGDEKTLILRSKS